MKLLFRRWERGVCGLLKSRDSLFQQSSTFFSMLLLLLQWFSEGVLCGSCIFIRFVFSVYFFPKITVHWLFTIVPFGLSFLYELIKGLLEIEFFGCYFRWGGVIRVLKRGWELLRFPASPICFLSLYFCPFVCFFFSLALVLFLTIPCSGASSIPCFREWKFKITRPNLSLAYGILCRLTWQVNRWMANKSYYLFFSL